jgi:hypothetical protein
MYDNGCRFGIAKVSMQLSKDMSGADHIRVIKEAGFDAGAYHWCDGIKNWPLQARLFTEQLQATTPKIRAFDVEQFWADWNDHSKILDEKRIVENFEYLLINTPSLDTKSLMYSAHWVMNSFIKTLYMRLGVIEAWMAHYTMARAFVMRNFGSYRLTSWSQVNELMSYMHENWKTWFDGSTPARIFVPSGFRQPLVFQIDSKTMLPGAPNRLDLNLFLGTDKEYDVWMGHTEPEPEPEPEPDPDELVRLWNELVALKQRVGVLEGYKIKVKEKLEEIAGILISEI